MILCTIFLATGCAKMGQKNIYTSAPIEEKPEFNDDLIDKLAHDCIEGVYGNYPLRKQKLNSLGYGNIYSIVQRRVNEIIYR